MPRATNGDHAMLTSAAGVHGFRAGNRSPRTCPIVAQQRRCPVRRNARPRAPLRACPAGRPAGGVRRYGWTPTPHDPILASAYDLGAAGPRPRPFRRSNGCSARSTLRTRSPGCAEKTDRMARKMQCLVAFTGHLELELRLGRPATRQVADRSVPLLDRPPLQMPTVRPSQA